MALTEKCGGGGTPFKTVTADRRTFGRDYTTVGKSNCARRVAAGDAETLSPVVAQVASDADSVRVFTGEEPFRAERERGQNGLYALG